MELLYLPRPAWKRGRPSRGITDQKAQRLDSHFSRQRGHLPQQTSVRSYRRPKDVAGHQTFQMPSFRDRFRQTEGQRDYNSAETRIREIVNYLESLQATE